MQQDYESYLYHHFFSNADLETSIKNYDAQLRSGNQIIELAEKQVNILLKNQTFKNGFVLSAYNSNLLIDEYSRIIETTIQLINLIDDEFNI
jgi:uncharacterized membrane protein